jgi:hypothetical protein
MQTIEIPQYIREVNISKARRIRYYEYGKKPPKAKKYLDRTKYDYRLYPMLHNKKFLTNLETGERVVANPKSAGTPKNVTINGQKIYNQEIGKHQRGKLLSAIKENLKPYVEQLQPITKFPICIFCEIHDTIRESSSHNLWDCDNRSYPYIKAFQDCLTGDRGKSKQLIPDDNILFITQPPVPKFIPVSSSEERKLVFIITEEKDPRILKNKEYQNELKYIYDRKDF